MKKGEYTFIRQPANENEYPEIIGELKLTRDEAITVARALNNGTGFQIWLNYPIKSRRLWSATICPKGFVTLSK